MENTNFNFLSFFYGLHLKDGLRVAMNLQIVDSLFYD